MPMSVGTLVVWKTPWLKFVVVLSTLTPRPTDRPTGRLIVACSETCWNDSVKFATLALKPSVFALAMLLPMTSISVWSASMPLTPENNDWIILVFLDWAGRCWEEPVCCCACC
jgi:hypothetical protein